MKYTKHIFILCCFLLLLSCKTTVVYQDKIDTNQPYREVPYQLFKQKKSSSKVALILPDNPDTLNIANAEVTALLKKEGYDILVINKPGSTIQDVHSLDSREGRLADIVSVYQQEIAGQYEHFLLIGIGEGAYLVPKLSHPLQSDTSIVINIGIKSPLHDYSEWVIADSLTPRQTQILHAKNIVDLDELKTRISNTWANEFGAEQLAPNTNHQWLSYAQAPFIQEIFAVAKPIYWINFDGYAMTSAAHRKEAALYSTHYLINYIELEGSGNLNNEEQMLLLVDKLKTIILPR
ncbi:hypothetical protein [Owenweeksia hongkongensis]|uniref:hypothetical protein n=1 Tax=Owenweeksia hongkongensis TaxID=253245 RepID=UPI003A92D1F1